MPDFVSTLRSGSLFRPNVFSLTNKLPGLLLASICAMAAMFLSNEFGGPVMLYALAVGMTFNFIGTDKRFAPGITFSSKTLLRTGIAFLGVGVTVAEIASLGFTTVITVFLGLFLTITVGTRIGQAFDLTKEHSVLSACSVAICGASAALAVSSVLPDSKDAERNTIITVFGVTALSTIAMILYPIIASSIGFDLTQTGIFLGATIHDVAQVIGAGYMVSDETGMIAAVVKLMRVIYLAPVVMIISYLFLRRMKKKCPQSKAANVPILPTFLVVFIMFVALNSLNVVPPVAVHALSEASRAFLVTAVAALGIKTSFQDIKSVGPAPIYALTAQTIFLATFIIAAILITT